MVESFNDGNSNVWVAYLDALSKLMQQGKRVTDRWLGLVSFMEAIVEFRSFIGPIIPVIVDLVKDSKTSVCVACAKALSMFSEHGKKTGLLNLLC